MNPGWESFCVCDAEDQTSNLLWRLQHGEVFLKHLPQVTVLLIGTNDLGAAASCNVGEPGATAAANGTAARYSMDTDICVLNKSDSFLVLIGTNDLGAAASCIVGEPGAAATANGTAAWVIIHSNVNSTVKPETLMLPYGDAFAGEAGATAAIRFGISPTDADVCALFRRYMSK